MSPSALQSSHINLFYWKPFIFELNSLCPGYQHHNLMVNYNYPKELW